MGLDFFFFHMFVGLHFTVIYFVVFVCWDV